MIDTDNAENKEPNTTGRSGGTSAAAAMQRAEQSGASSEARQAEHIHVGQVFLDWFNSKLNLLTNPTVTLGTKQAHAVRLHPDGRLECVLSGVEGEGAIQFVAFEQQYLDQLMRKIAAIGL